MTKISELPAGAAVSGTEETPAVQAGSTVKITINQIKTYLFGLFGLATNNTFTGTNTFTTGPVVINTSGVALRPFVNSEIVNLVLSGSMDYATQGETILHFDTYGANSNGTILFTKSGGGAEFTGSVSGSTLTVSAMVPGSTVIAVGQILMALGVPTGTTITALGTGTGGIGTYTLSASVGTVGSESMLSNDSPATPTATKNAEGIGYLVASGWYDNAGTPTRTTQSSLIGFFSDGDWTATSWPSRINFWTTPSGSAAPVLCATLASGGALNMYQNSIGGTLTDGLVLRNDTAAAAGAQQISPSLHLIGQGWKTNATAASQTVDWALTNSPSQGTAAPSTNLVFGAQINGGGFVKKADLSSGGVFNAVTGYIVAGAAATSGHVLRGNGTNFVDAAIASADLPAVLIGGSAVSSTLTLQSTSGVGSSDAIIFQTGSQVERARILTGGNFGIGSNNPIYNLVLNANVTNGVTGFSINTDTIVQIVAKDTKRAGLELNVFGSQAVLRGVRADGTAASPAALAGADEAILNFQAIGYDGSSYVSSGAFIFWSSQTWTAGSHAGCYGTVYTTPNNTQTSTEAVRFQASGGVSIGTTTDPGIGGLLATGLITTSGAGVGYATGAGGAITQITSRTTGVALNKASGAVTLFSAAGSATAASFTVTNSTVAATDTISLSVKSATNKYRAYVTAVAAGSFEITFETTGGTSTDAPVINFNVLKGVIS